VRNAEARAYAEGARTDKLDGKGFDVVAFSPPSVLARMLDCLERDVSPRHDGGLHRRVRGWRVRGTPASRHGAYRAPKLC